MSTAACIGKPSNFKEKALTLTELCTILNKYSTDCVYDAACILTVEHELKRAYMNNDISLNVYIAGPTCSGKTTLAKRIELYFKTQGYSVCTVHQDDYYKNLKKIPRCRGGYYVDGLDAFHVDEMIGDFKKLLEEGRVQVPYYDFRYNKRTGHRPAIKRGKINIVEGLHVIRIFGYDPNGIYFYMNTPIEKCIERRIIRDTKLIGVSEERAQRYFNECILPMYEKDILPQYYFRGLDRYYRYIDS